MNLSLTINAESVDHLKAELRRFLETEAAAPAKALDLSTGAGVPQEIIPPTKRTKKSEAKPEPVTIEAKAEVVESKPADIEDLRRALKAVAEKDGLGREGVFKLLGEFGATNATTVKEGDRAAVIQKANEMVGA